MVSTLILATLFAASDAQGARGVRDTLPALISPLSPLAPFALSTLVPDVPGGLASLSALRPDARLAPLEAAVAQATTPEARAVLRAIAGGAIPGGLSSGELTAIQELAAGLRARARVRQSFPRSLTLTTIMARRSPTLTAASNVPRRKLLDPAEASPHGVAGVSGFSVSPDG